MQMRESTARENAEAAVMIESGRSMADVAAHFGISVDGLNQRGRRDPAFGAVLATVKRPRLVRTPELEAQLVDLWFQPETYTVPQIAAALGVARQTVHRWANDLNLPPVRLKYRVRTENRPARPPKPVNEQKVIASLARQLRISEEGAARLVAGAAPSAFAAPASTGLSQP